MHGHTHSRLHTRTLSRSHTRARTGIRAHVRSRTGIRTLSRSHGRSRTVIRTRFHIRTHTGRYIRIRLDTRARSRIGVRVHAHAHAHAVRIRLTRPFPPSTSDFPRFLSFQEQYMADTSTKKGTIVRSNMLSRRQRMTRATFGMLERRAPWLGSRWAERLWCTVPTSDKARLVLAEPGTIATLPLDDTADAATAPTYVAESWGETGPIIYLIHGWGGYRGQLGAFVGPLTAAGYRVVALDVPSHGDAGPGNFGAGRSLLPDFTATLTAAVRAFGPAYAIVGHSLGGGAAALAVLDGLPVGRLVLIAPSPDASAYVREFAKALGFGDRVRSGLMHRIERRGGRPMTDYDAVSRARAAAEALRESGEDRDRGAPPLLVVHDHEDRKIPYRLGEAIASAWQGAELCSTRGLGHQRILSDPGVVSTVTQFLGVHTAAGRVGSASRSGTA